MSVSLDGSIEVRGWYPLTIAAVLVSLCVFATVLIVIIVTSSSFGILPKVMLVSGFALGIIWCLSILYEGIDVEIIK